MKYIIGLLYAILFSISIIQCNETEYVDIIEELNSSSTCATNVLDNGKYYESNGNTYLWGGEDSSTHFLINNWTLDSCNLNYGLGREAFNSPVNPQYELLSDNLISYQDTSRAIVIVGNQKVTVYPLSLLRTYETINETIDGTPIAIVYCFLIDLATVFEREYCGEVLTFAVSGYTYIRNSSESFVLWDRNSESLWWPIDAKGVSGLYKDQDMTTYNFGKWGVSTISRIRSTYPDAYVLMPIQRHNIPTNINSVTGCN